MSHQGKVYLWLLSLTISGTIVACGQANNSESIRDYPDEKTLMTHAVRHTGEEAYQRLYRQAADSLQVWCDNRLASSTELWYLSYQLDSLVCLNKTKDKLIGALLIPCTKADCKQDDIRYFYGAKIKASWYFFCGPTMVLPQPSPPVARTLPKLHKQAVQHIFRAYLKADSTRHWQINERFFGDLTSRAFCASCQTQQEWDVAYLQLAHNIWRYGQDTTKSDFNKESSLRIEP